VPSSAQEVSAGGVAGQLGSLSHPHPVHSVSGPAPPEPAAGGPPPSPVVADVGVLLAPPAPVVLAAFDVATELTADPPAP
jgi:hypothetical protein